MMKRLHLRCNMAASNFLSNNSCKKNSTHQLSKTDYVQQVALTIWMHLIEKVIYRWACMILLLILSSDIEVNPGPQWKFSKKNKKALLYFQNKKTAASKSVNDFTNESGESISMDTKDTIAVTSKMLTSNKPLPDTKNVSNLSFSKAKAVPLPATPISKTSCFSNTSKSSSLSETKSSFLILPSACGSSIISRSKDLEVSLSAARESSTASISGASIPSVNVGEPFPNFVVAASKTSNATACLGELKTSDGKDADHSESNLTIRKRSTADSDDSSLFHLKKQKMEEKQVDNFSFTSHTDIKRSNTISKRLLPSAGIAMSPVSCTKISNNHANSSKMFNLDLPVITSKKSSAILSHKNSTICRTLDFSENTSNNIIDEMFGSKAATGTISSEYDKVSKKDYNAKYYKNNQSLINLRRREKYANNRQHLKKDPEKNRMAVKRCFEKDPDRNRNTVKRCFEKDPDRNRNAVKRCFEKDPDRKRNAVKRSFDNNRPKKREAVKLNFDKDRPKKREAVKLNFDKDRPKKREAVKLNFDKDRPKKREAVKRNSELHRLEKIMYKNSSYDLKRQCHERLRTIGVSLSNANSLTLTKHHTPAAKQRRLREKERFSNYQKTVILYRYLRKIKYPLFGIKSKNSAFANADFIIRKLHCRFTHCLKRSFRSFYNARSLALSTLESSSDYNDSVVKFSKFTGVSKHTSTQVPYFCFMFGPFSKALPVRDDGTIIPDSTYVEYSLKTYSVSNQNATSENSAKDSQEELKTTGFRWECSKACGWGANNYTEEVCCALEKALSTIASCNTNDISKLVSQMTFCTVGNSSCRSGHDQSCYEQISKNSFKNTSGCDSMHLTLLRLQHHFSRIRTLQCHLHDMRNNYIQAMSLKSVLEEGPSEWLQKYESLLEMGIFRQYTESMCVDLRPSTDEQVIKRKFAAGIDVFYKNIADLPTISCLSCRTLKSRAQCIDLKRCHLKLNNLHLLQRILDESNLEESCDLENSSKYFCHLCYKNLKFNNLPALCYLNKMDVTRTCSELSSLNEWELLLTQRAKAFQTITVPRSVSGRRKPSSQCLRKGKGMVLHLPLPLEDTLKTVLSDTEVVRTGNLHIAVRTGLGEKKIIWQDLVRIEKVYEALRALKYKYENPLYKNVHIPSTLDEFKCLFAQKQVDTCELETIFEEDDSCEVDPNVIVQEENNEPSTSTSILAPITAEESKLYEQYTIMPINNQRIPTEVSTFFKLEHVKGDPLHDHQCENLDAQCFPTLYPDAKFIENDPVRAIPVPKSDFSRARLLSVDPKFRQSIPYLFYLHNKKTFSALSTGIYLAMNVIKSGSKLTAGETMKKLERGELDKDISTIFSKVRGTQEYFKIPKLNVDTMLRSYGPAAWFFTYSPCEWLMPDLKTFLLAVNKNLDESLSISELTARDPVSTAIYIDNRFDAILKFILSDSEPLGKVSHHFVRREYQGRGMSHFHCMLWVDGAPTIGVDGEEDIAKFIQKYCTCELPPKESILYELVNTIQRHHCNSYCQKTRKSKYGVNTYCRFKFPRDVCEHFKLHDVAESIAARNSTKKLRLYDLPRSKDEVCINDYNPVLAYLGQGNIDIQFTKEKSSTVCAYVCKYAHKGETSTLELDFKKSAKSTTSTLYSLGLKGLQSRDVGTIEAADTMLGHWLTKTDRNTKIKWVDTRSNKCRKLKTKKDLIMDESSTNIFLPDDVDDRFPNRHQTLENVCLFDYMSNYDNASPSDIKNRKDLLKVNKDLGYIKHRAIPALISHPIPNKRDMPEEYYRTFLLLFKPWRSKIDILNSCRTYKDSFDLEITHNSKMKEYEENISDQHQCSKLMEDAIDKEVEKVAEEEEDITPEHIHFSAEITETVAHEFEDIQRDDAIHYSSFIKNFNAGQLKVFINIVSTLHKQNPEVEIPPDVVNLINSSCQPEKVFTFVSGVGGTGKSYVIKALSSYVKQVFQSPVALMAPTGIAASNISGMTVHRLLHMPVQHGCTPPYIELTDSTLQQIYAMLKDVKLFILDEISMVSNVMFTYIHRRLQDIFGIFDQNFAGRNFVFLGDLFQLAPVKNGPCFLDLCREEKKLLKGLCFVNLWERINYEELSENVRQSQDTRFAAILEDIRLGFLKSEDQDWLSEKCSFKFRTVSKDSRRKEVADFIFTEMKRGNMYTILLPTNEAVRQINEAVLDKVDGKLYKADCDDCISTSKKATNNDKSALHGYIKRKVAQLDKDPRNTAGLESSFNFKIGAKVMLRRNIDVSKGLCNGAVGTVEKIGVHPLNRKRIQRLFVRFNDQLHEINRVKSDFFVSDYRKMIKIQREQFPLTLAYAMTIHKAQGLTLEHVIVDCGEDIFSSGQTYVAMSRVTSSNNLILLNFSLARLKSCDMAFKEYNRLRALKNLPLLKRGVVIGKKTRKCVQKNVSYIERSQCFDVLTKIAPEVDTTVCIGGFYNSLGISCYANSLVQCLFNILPYNSVLPLGELGNVARAHRAGTRQSLDGFRREIGFGFQENVIQCPAEFLDQILSLSPYDSLANDFCIKIQEWNRCTNDSCSHETPRSDSLKYHHPVCPVQGNNLIVQELLKRSIEDQVLDATCSVCQFPLKSNTQIISTSKYLVLMVIPNREGDMKLETKVKEIPKKRINILDKIYNFNCMLSHRGDLHTQGEDDDREKPSAHYVSYVKRTKWICINDVNVYNDVKWPTNGYDANRKESPYLLFYKKV